MDPRSPTSMLLAPGAASHAVSAPSYAPAPRQPPIDENVLAEDAAYEIVDGQVFELSPAEEEHGSEHFQLPAVLGAHLAPAYKGTVDMLTRPSTGSNYAPDVSIIARARDPKTGGRHVEDIIFEVIDTESRAHVSDKTRKLIARGVRRAFLIDVNDRSIHEWSREADGWARLADDGVIEDRCFAVPVPARALLDEALNQDVLAASLIAQKNQVIAGVEQRAEQRAELRASRRLLRTVARAAGIALSAEDDARIDACDDVATLERWASNVSSAKSAEALLR